MDEKERKTRVVLVVITTLTLLIMIAGTTFAYLNATVTGNETASSVLLKSSTLGIMYDSGPTFTAILKPGDSATKTFTVTNIGDNPVMYNVVWVDVFNGIINDELEFSVDGIVASGTGSASSKALAPTPTTNEDMLSNITINGNTVHVFTLTVKLKNLATLQDYNLDKTFSARIQISLVP